MKIAEYSHWENNSAGVHPKLAVKARWKNEFAVCIREFCPPEHPAGEFIQPKSQPFSAPSPATYSSPGTQSEWQESEERMKLEE